MFNVSDDLISYLYDFECKFKEISVTVQDEYILWYDNYSDIEHSFSPVREHINLDTFIRRVKNKMYKNGYILNSDFEGCYIMTVEDYKNENTTADDMLYKRDYEDVVYSVVIELDALIYFIEHIL